MKTVEELRKNIEESNKMTKVDISSLCGYDPTNYLEDPITEIADNYVDIYNNDLLEWVKHNYSYIEEALDDFGVPKDMNGKSDFIKIIQQGQYYKNCDEIQKNLDDMLKVYILDLLQKNAINEISEKQLVKLDKLIENWKARYYLGNIEDIKESLEV